MSILATEDQSRDVRSVRTKNLKILEAETKEAIQRLLKRKSNGIPMKELPAFYKVSLSFSGFQFCVVF